MPVTVILNRSRRRAGDVPQRFYQCQTIAVGKTQVEDDRFIGNIGCGLFGVLSSRNPGRP